MEENYSLMDEKKTDPTLLGLLRKLWRNIHTFFYRSQGNKTFVQEEEEVNNTLIAGKC